MGIFDSSDEITKIHPRTILDIKIVSKLVVDRYMEPNKRQISNDLATNNVIFSLRKKFQRNLTLTDVDRTDPSNELIFKKINYIASQALKDEILQQFKSKIAA